MGTTRNALTGWVVAGLLAAASPASAQTLFYQGDLNAQSGYSNFFRNYDLFHVGAGGWEVSGIFGDYLTTGHWTFADFEIRSGMTQSSLGSLLFSGLGTATQDATGRSGWGMTEYRAKLSGLNLFLGEGDYWLAMNPYLDGPGAVYVSSTLGLNAENAVNDSHGYSTQGGSDSYLFYRDFSYGMTGAQGIVLPEGPQVDNPSGDPPNIDTASTTVPEPSTWLLMASGLAALAAVAKRRKAQG